jgi:DNA repair exonuclease SbcCD ATPase subunit
MNIKSISDKIQLFNQDKCPTCGTSFSTKKFETLRSQLNALQKEKQDLDNELKGKLKEINDNNKTVMDYLNKISAAA